MTTDLGSFLLLLTFLAAKYVTWQILLCHPSFEGPTTDVAQSQYHGAKDLRMALGVKVEGRQKKNDDRWRSFETLIKSADCGGILRLSRFGMASSSLWSFGSALIVLSIKMTNFTLPSQSA